MSKLELANVIGTEIRELLESRKTRLFEEIRLYPTPIAGCDQQFNYLLEQQALAVRELAAARQIVALEPTDGNVLRRLADFVISSLSIDEESKQRLLSRLFEASSKVDDNAATKPHVRIVP